MDIAITIPDRVMNQLDFEAMEKRFGHGVIPTIGFSTHALDKSRSTGGIDENRCRHIGCLDRNGRGPRASAMFLEKRIEPFVKATTEKNDLVLDVLQEVGPLALWLWI